MTYCYISRNNPLQISGYCDTGFSASGYKSNQVNLLIPDFLCSLFRRRLPLLVLATGLTWFLPQSHSFYSVSLCPTLDRLAYNISKCQRYYVLKLSFTILCMYMCVYMPHRWHCKADKAIFQRGNECNKCKNNETRS